jgi:Zn-finger nucleic acid-binding protein
MLCPKCSVTRSWISKSLSPCSKTGAHHCASCKGYWVEPLPYILKAQSRITHKAINDIRDQKSKQQPKLKCPKDKDALYAFFYDGVELDYCPKCRGLWFDDSELDKLKKIKQQQEELFSNPTRTGAVGETLEGFFALFEFLEFLEILG